MSDIANIVNPMSDIVYFSENKIQEDYMGLCGVFPCFWFLKDDTMDEQYTPEQLEFSIKKLMQMGMSMVRCFNFEPAFAWEEDKEQWNWDNDWMQGFYKYCDLMKENNIDIIINTSEAYRNEFSRLVRKNPIYYLAKKRCLEEGYKNYDETYHSDSKKFNEYLHFYYGKWVVDFVKEVIIKRGYTNIKYWEESTEPNNSSRSREKFEFWSSWLISAVNALEEEGLRHYLKQLGPSIAMPIIWVTSLENIKWVEWSTTELNDYIDIYAVHCYSRPNEFVSNDTYFYWETFINVCQRYIKQTGKPFWIDEFNVTKHGYGYREISEHPFHATQLALAQIAHMSCGVGCSMLWYPVDIKFPNKTTTGGEFKEGIHYAGLDRSILVSKTPRNGYYSYALLGTAIKPGDKVYRGTYNSNNVHTILLEHLDGTHSIIAVNLSYFNFELKYVLPESVSLNAKFSKAFYDPDTFVATPEAEPILPSDELLSADGVLVDNIGAYQVIVLNEI